MIHMQDPPKVSDFLFLLLRAGVLLVCNKPYICYTVDFVVLWGTQMQGYKCIEEISSAAKPVSHTKDKASARAKYKQCELSACEMRDLWNVTVTSVSPTAPGLPPRPLDTPPPPLTPQVFKSVWWARNAWSVCLWPRLPRPSLQRPCLSSGGCFFVSSPVWMAACKFLHVEVTILFCLKFRWYPTYGWERHGLGWALPEKWWAISFSFFFCLFFSFSGQRFLFVDLSALVGSFYRATFRWKVKGGCLKTRCDVTHFY